MKRLLLLAALLVAFTCGYLCPRAPVYAANLSGPSNLSFMTFDYVPNSYGWMVFCFHWIRQNTVTEIPIEVAMPYGLQTYQFPAGDAKTTTENDMPNWHPPWNHCDVNIRGEVTSVGTPQLGR